MGVPRLAGSSNRPLPKTVKFTETAIKDLKCPASEPRSWYYDEKQPGLTVMVTAKKKSFYLYRRVNGRPQHLKLGGWPDITVDQARQVAQQKVGDIAAGKNPMAERRASRAKSMTIGQLWTWFLDNWAKPRKRSWLADQSRYDNHLKSWESKRLTDITRTNVAALHQRVAKSASPTTANRVIALLSTMYRKAGRIGVDIANPCDGVESFKETSRDRFLSADELKRFVVALDGLADANWRDFFKVCLFSGARRGNVLAIRWDEIDLTAGRWAIPAEKFKNGKAVMVHLPAPAIEILNKRWGSKDNGPWVFPGPGKTGHLTTPTKPWKIVVKEAKLPGLRIHDLRRTLGSWQAAAGSSLPIIGKSLGHASTAATAVYARLELDPVKQSVDAATAAMMNAINPPSTAKADTTDDQYWVGYGHAKAGRSCDETGTPQYRRGYAAAGAEKR